MAWCVGYTTCVTMVWCIMQGMTLFTSYRPALGACAWEVLGALVASSFILRAGNKVQQTQRSFAKFSLPLTGLLGGIWLIAFTLSFGSTTFKAGMIEVPQNILRDLYSHVALIRSFSVGYNFPTEYPFFEGEVIRYHFLFYFGGGVLEALGAPLSVALNIPSMLSLGSLLSFASFLTWRISGSFLAGFLAIVLWLFRSSLSWVDWLLTLLRAGTEKNSTLQQNFFYGVTPFEDWGIFSPNVHLNQRHLMHGLAWMMLALVVCVCTPPLQRMFRDRMSWSYCFLGVLIGAGAYWNGAAFLATFMALLPLMLAGAYRHKAVLVIIPAVCSSVLIVSLVTQGTIGATPFQPILRFGFLSASTAPLEVLGYFGWIFGILPIVALWAACSYRPLGPIVWTGGLMPIMLVFFVQITEFPPQDHKLINAGTLLWSVLAAGIVVSLCSSARFRVRIGGQLIFLLLILTGITDVCALIKLSNVTHGYPVDDATIRWIQDNTERDAVFLTASRGDQAPCVAGRRLFIGPKSLLSETGYGYEKRVAWLRSISALDYAAQVVALREQGITHISNDVCRPMKGLLSDECPMFPEVAILMANPMLHKVYGSDQLVIYEVPATR